MTEPDPSGEPQSFTPPNPQLTNKPDPAVSDAASLLPPPPPRSAAEADHMRAVATALREFTGTLAEVRDMIPRNPFDGSQEQVIQRLEDALAALQQRREHLLRLRRWALELFTNAPDHHDALSDTFRSLDRQPAVLVELVTSTLQAIRSTPGY